MIFYLKNKTYNMALFLFLKRLWHRALSPSAKQKRHYRLNISYLVGIFLLLSQTAISAAVGYNYSTTKVATMQPLQPYAPTCFVDIAVADLPVANLQSGQGNVLQLFSHGRSGELLLDGQWRNAAQIAKWLHNTSLLTHKQHLNIYGCEFAKGAKGQAAVAYLEKELGITVAASNNITGRSGDWTLEVGHPVAAIALTAYAGNLQCSTAITNNMVQNTSCSSPNGSITITNAFSPLSDYEFSKDGGVTWQSGATFSNLAAGANNMRYRHLPSGCLSNIVVVSVTNNIVAPAVPLAASTPIVNNTSCATPNGTITFTTTPVAASEYSIDGGVTWQASNTFAGLSAGTYSAVYRATATGCVSTALSRAVTNPTVPAVPTAANTPIVNNTSCATPNGTITFTTTPVAASEYSIDGGATWQVSNTFTGLTAGTYSAVYRAASNGCVSAALSRAVTNPTAPAVPLAASTPIVNNTSCATPNGTITFTTTPVAASEYSIDGGATWQVSNTFTGLTAGTYSAVYRAASNGCVSAALSRAVTNPTAPAVPLAASTPIVNNTSCDTPNGTITFTTTPVAASEYSIDGGATWQVSNTFTGLTAGTYSAVYRAASNGCVSAALSRAVTNPTAPAVPTAANTPIVNNTSCDTPNGTITFTTTPVAASEYSIDGGATWQASNTFTGLDAGTYSAVYRAASNGCVSAALSRIVTSPTAVTTPAPTIAANTNCTTAPNGSITFPAASYLPSGNFNFSIDGGVTWQLSNVFLGLPAGNYNLIAKNTTTGCVSATTISNVADNPATIANPTLTQTASNCVTNTGVVTVTNPIGANFQYSIDYGVTWQTATTFTGLAARYYYVMVKNTTTGCTSSEMQPAYIEVLNPATPAAPLAANTPIVNNTSCATPNGTITFTSTPVAASEYSIDGGVTWQTSNTFTGLSAGAYSAVYRAVSNGCISTALVRSVTGPASPAAPTAANTPIVNATNCASPNGSITFNVTPVAASEYSIDGGATWQTSNTFVGLAPGIYTAVYRASATSCQSLPLSRTITAPAVPTTPTATSVANTNCAAPNGTITVTAPTPLTSYTFSIDNGVTWQSSQYFVGLEAGTYSVVAKSNATGCVSVALSATIAAPTAVALPVITLTNATDCTPNNGSIVFTTTIDDYNYQYSIDGGDTWQASNSFTGLGSGAYDCMVKKLNTGCTSPVGVRTLTNGSPAVTAAVINATSCTPNGRITVSAPALGTGYEYSIDGGTTWQVNNIFNNLDYGTYSVVVRNTTTGCVSNPLARTVTNTAAVSIPTFSITPQVCSNIDGKIEVLAPTPLVAYQFSKDGGTTWQASPLFSNLTGATYPMRTKSLASGCVSQVVDAVVPHETAGCVSSDADLLVDKDDLDDDNDGILDTDEIQCPALLYTNSGMAVINGGYPNSTITTPEGATATLTTNFNTGLGGAAPNIFTDPAYPTVSFVSTQIGAGPGATGNQSYTLNVTSGSITNFRWGIGGADLNIPASVGVASENGNFVFNWTGGGTAILRDPDHQIMNQPDGAILSPGQSITTLFRGNTDQLTFYVDFSTGSDSSGTFRLDIDETYVAGIGGAGSYCCDIFTVSIPYYDQTRCEDKDTDSDGISDRLDLDSDADGCADAIEGGAAFVSNDLATSTMPGGSTNIQSSLCITNACVDANGIPTVSGIPQLVGASQDSTIQDINCLCTLPTVSAPTVTQPTCSVTTGTIVVNATGTGTLEYSVDNGTTWSASNTFAGLAVGTYNIVVREQATPICTTTYSGNPVTLTAAIGCCGSTADNDDYDCDGVANSTDLDDDNDGILDTVECSPTAGNFVTLTAAEITAPTQTNYPGYPNSISTLLQTLSSLSSTTSGNSMLWYQETAADNGGVLNGNFVNQLIVNPNTAINNLSGIALWVPSVTQNFGDAPLREFTITVTHSGGTWTSPVYMTQQPTVAGQPNTGQLFSFGQSFSGVTNVTLNTLNGWFDTNTGYYNFVNGTPATGWVSTTSPSAMLDWGLNNQTYNMSIAAFRLMSGGSAGGASCDTDGDLIPNIYDLDSDADGCADAIEGGAAFVSNDLATSTMPGGSTNIQTSLCITSACVDSTGVPTILGTPQLVGASQDSTIQDINCLCTLPTVSAPTVTQPTCSVTTGTIVVNAIGTNTLEYSVDNGTTWSASNTFASLAAGTYNIVVREQADPACTATYSGNPITLTAATGCCTPPTVSAPTVTQPTCSVTTGTIVVNATGAGTLEYSVDNGTTWSASNTFASLAAGTYNIVVREQADPACTATYSGNPITLTAATGCSVCGGIAANDDYDCDGVANSTDLDDDNDGILDTVENTCTVPPGVDQANPNLDWDRNSGQAVGSLEQNDFAPATITANSTITMGAGLNYTPIASSWQFDNLTATTVTAAVTAQQYMTVTIPTASTSTKIVTITHWLTYNSYLPQTPNIAIWISTDSTFASYTTLYDGVNPNANTATSSFIPIPLNAPYTFEYGPTYYVRVIVSGSGPVFYMDAFGFNGYCQTDTDGDYIANIFDLDSDADGCADAIEGGAAFADANLVASTMPSGSTNIQTSLCITSACVDSTGVPTILGSPQTVGSSQDSTVLDVNCVICTPPTISAPTVTQPTCSVTTGTIVVNATGAGTLEYSVDNGTTWSASNTFASLAAGTYNIVVREQADPACTTTYSGNPITLTAATGCCTPPTISAPTVTQPTCSVTTGTIVVNATGTNTLEYSVDNGTTWSASNTFASLAAGTYNVVVREQADPACTTTYSGNPITLTAATGCCTGGDTSSTGDFDCDGVANNTDLDDDNDGILDTSEQTCGTFTTNHKLNGGISVFRDNSSTFSIIAGVGSDNNVDEGGSAVGNNDTNYYVAYGTQDESIVQTFDKPVSQVIINNVKYISGSGIANTELFEVYVNGTFYPITAAMLTGLSANSFITASGAIGGSITGVYTSFSKLTISIPNGITSIRVRNNPNGTSALNGFAVESIQAVYCEVDTDGDGIYDRFDLDSDADGCADAIEGSAGFVNSDLEASTMPGGSTNIQNSLCITSACVDATGVPTILGSPQTVGSSQDSTVLDVNCVICTPPTISAPTVTQPTCSVTTGTIVVNATGAGTLEYSVDNGTTWSASNTFASLAAGTYNIVVREQADPACTTTYSGNPITLTAATGCCTGGDTSSTGDFDCDGVANSTDLDDDNDGILDTVECEASVAVSNMSDWNPIEDASTSGTELIVTPNLQGQRGASWYNNQVSINQAFNYKFQANLGADNNGADGIAFVISTDPRGTTAIGENGWGLGVYDTYTGDGCTTTYQSGGSGCRNGVFHSLVIEMDTYHNGNDFGDLTSNDHLSIQNNSNAGQIWDNTYVDMGNIEDGLWHDVEVDYDGTVLRVYFDNVLRITTTTNISADFLGGSTTAYIGYTSSTGSNTNLQQIRPISFSMAAGSCPDTDNDGTTNNFDLDSDADNCSDANEAGTTTSTTANYQFSTASTDNGANGFFNTLETSTESGVYSGTYTYSNATDSSMITCPNCILPTINAPTVTQPNCTVATGTIVVNATGTNTLEYSVDNGTTWSASNTFAGLAAGTYNIVVREQADSVCTATYSGNPVTLTAATGCDSDGDGVTNAQELIDGTDPNDSCDLTLTSVTILATSTGDCDGDGVTNAAEINGPDNAVGGGDGTDPNDACDFNASQITIAVTSTADCDGDGVTNAQELIDGTDPNDACDLTLTSVTILATSTGDCDGDGVTNAAEINGSDNAVGGGDGTDPNDACDFNASQVTLLATSTGDCDGDGVTNAAEINGPDNAVGGGDGTDPNDACDFNASQITIAVTSTADCDGDGVTNAQELIDGTDPNDSCDLTLTSVTILATSTGDCDGDGVTNAAEINGPDNAIGGGDGTNALDPCAFNASQITIAVTSTADCDGDGVTNAQELIDGTDPNDSCDLTLTSVTILATSTGDCDGDGVTNAAEINGPDNAVGGGDGTDPNDACDFNASQITIAVTSTADCDGDGVTNAQELIDGTDPNDSCDLTLTSVTILATSIGDCDGDGVTNAAEINGPDNAVGGGDGTDPNDACDFNASQITIAVTSTADCDGDGVTNAQELIDGTDPNDSCDLTLTSVTILATSTGDCDGDGVTNAAEINGPDNAVGGGDGTDPNDACAFNLSQVTLLATSTGDCDGDGVTNAAEINGPDNAVGGGDGTNALDPCDFNASQITIAVTSAADCDGDGVTNAQELIDGTDPNDSCDLTLTSVTILATSTGDCDGDGVTNAAEINGPDNAVGGGDGTDPNDACDFNASQITIAVTSTADCDGDGVTNAQELIDGTDPNDSCDLTLTSVTILATSTGDCDGDGVTNAAEINGPDNAVGGGDGTDPNDACDFNASQVTLLATSTGDCDGDGVTNAQELIDGTDPNDSCDLTLTSVTILATSTGDCDGDGVTNAAEINGPDNAVGGGDGTDPNDACDFNASQVTLLATSTGDCDGDGVTNAAEINGPDNAVGGGDGTDPNDACDFNASQITIAVTSTADCDGDGVTNAQELIDGTDPNDSCDLTLTSVTILATSTGDCDGDGVTNAAEINGPDNAVGGGDGTDPNDACDFNLSQVTLLATSTGDCDGDGVTNAAEINGPDNAIGGGDGTNALDPCDFNASQITIAVTSTADCDGDGVTNAQELIDGTDPNDSCDLTLTSVTILATSTGDCDGDGVTNAAEINGPDNAVGGGDGTDPNDACDFNASQITIAVTSTADCDGDGVTNAAEINGSDNAVGGGDGTDPNDACDFNESQVTLLATSTGDCDGDGVTNAAEINGPDNAVGGGDGTDPNDACDFNASQITIAVTSTADCDGDGVTNAQELIDGTDPNDSCDLTLTSVTILATSTGDCDGDGVTNAAEINGPDNAIGGGDGTNALDPCDFNASQITIAVTSTADCDGDGVTNAQELIDGTDPNDSCDLTLTSVTILATSTGDCDGDGVTNAAEINGPDNAIGGGDGTDPNDACDFNLSQVTLLATSTGDCDGDGVTNAAEINGPDNAVGGGDGTDPNDACDFNASQITIAVTSTADCDGDGVTNAQELIDGTDPNDSCDLTLTSVTILATSTGDCDGDGVTNAAEVNGSDNAVGGGDGTDPNDACDFNASQVTLLATSTGDCDGDGVTNAAEINGPDNAIGGGDGTDPNDACDFNASQITIAVTSTADCDGDGVTNAQELIDGTDPNDSCDLTLTSVTILATSTGDCDGDGVTNAAEVNGPDNAVGGGDGTDPNDACDFNASQITIAVTSTADCDGDGVTNAQELIDGTDPNDSCDLTLTSVTILATSTGDCDGDGVTNAAEINGPDNAVGGGDGTDPNDACDFNASQVTLLATSTGDCDGDGVTNAAEINGPDNAVGGGDGTDPNDACDFNASQITIAVTSTADCDGDGVTNAQELIDGTDPNDSCDLTLTSVTILATSTGDCDGDGVTNAAEINGPDNAVGGGDGTDPNDACDLTLTSVTILATSTGDCDGDGVTNAAEINGPDNAVGGGDGTDPNDACDFNASQITIAVTSTADCDGDGVTNAQELIDGTDPNDSCDLTLTSVTILATSTGDCDGDGVTNAAEINGPDNAVGGGDGTDPNDACDFNASQITIAVTSTADCDGDGVTNAQELIDGTDPNDSCDLTLTSVTILATSTGDCDGDGVTNAAEINGPDNAVGGGDGTDPNDACDFNASQVTLLATSTGDCDGDGVTNAAEINGPDNAIGGGDGTNALDPCDFNASQITIAVTSTADCDGDGVTNAQELIDGTDPNDSCDLTLTSVTILATSTGDCDGDGVTNAAEINGPDNAVGGGDGTDPNDACDFNASQVTLLATSTGDCDGDGVTNAAEINGPDNAIGGGDGTNALDPCDFNASQITIAVTSAADCDGDGVTNAQELIDGTDPNDSCDLTLTSVTILATSTGDCDGDGVTNAAEINGPDNAVGGGDGTDPNDACDFNASQITIAVTSTADCDGDGVTNAQELIDGTDPNDSCDLTLTSVTILATSTGDCDGDGVTNAAEINGPDNAVGGGDGTDPNDACDFNASQVTLLATSTGDCDGDGVTNAAEINGPDNAIGGGDDTNALDPCDFNASQITIAVTSTADCDGDGVTNAQELIDGTDPNDSCDLTLTSVTILATSTGDCDGDGVTNAAEINGPDNAVGGGDGTDPNDACDFNASQITIAVTSTADCDGDGVTNAQELIDGTDPNDSCDLTLTSVTILATSTGDCDGDGVTNAAEINGPDNAVGGGDGTDPNDACDFNASQITIAVTSTADCDGDGVTNAQELIDGTDPNDSCDLTLTSVTILATSTGDCDGDGVTNAAEINGPDNAVGGGDGTDPNDACDFNASQVTLLATSTGDCDGDGVTNAAEINGPDNAVGGGDGTDPNDACDFNASQITIAVTSTADCDGDGVTNAQELIDGTDPNDSCDLTLTSVTILATSTGDCDGDGVTNAAEINGPDNAVGGGDGTDPNDACDFNLSQVTLLATSTGDCDGDGVTNAAEINGPDNAIGGGDGTDPNDACDFNASQITIAVTSTADCDGDGVTNAQELIDGTDPNDSCDLTLTSVTILATSTGDCDGDGVTNAAEINGPDNAVGGGDGTDPNDACDFNASQITIAVTSTADCDGDGVRLMHKS
jgi:hypothetical protein